MSVPKTDGGGVTPPKTTTPGGPTDASSTSPSTTTSTATGGSRRTGTDFDRRPADDKPRGGELDDAARRNALRQDPESRRRPLTDRDEPRRPRPGKPGSDVTDVAETSARRRERETSNDGRVDGGVREGGHVGARDVAIERLKQKQEQLRAERTEIERDITELKDEIKSDKDKSGIVGTAVDIATSPVTAVAGLFGRSNPISDAAKAATERVLGLEGEQRDLEVKKTDLSTQEQAIADEIDRLEDERTLNFLADVAQVTNMPKPVTDVLEGSSNLDIKVVKETAIGSDAAYDRQSGEIVVDDDVLDKVNESITELRKDNIVDADGNIIDAEGFDQSSAGDTAIGATVLVGVHEVTHGAQDVEGKIEAAAQAGQAIISDARQSSRRFGPEDSKAVVDSAKKDAELQRIDALEYDSYVNQETIELQAGKQKKVFTTINPDGSLLPREQAVENIYQLQLGQPMLHGTSQGMTVGATGTQSGTQASGDQATGGDGTGGRFSGADGTGGRFSGGDGVPGRFSGADGTGGRFSGGDGVPGRFSGADGTGGRFSGGDWLPAYLSGGRFSGGDDVPGRFSGADETGGRFSGGDWLPAYLSGGRFSGGDDIPGRFSGADETGGRFSGGDAIPGRFSGGDETGGRFSGGDWLPAFLSGGRFSGGDETGGRFSGGDEIPGRFSGGDETGGRFSGGDLIEP